MELFAKITRRKERFDTSKGLLTIEDVWDLPLTSVRGPNLDDLAKGLKKELAEVSEESFVEIKSDKAKVVEDKFNAVLYIIKVKLNEKAEAEKEAEKRQRRELILELMQDKEKEELKGKSLDELKKMLNSL